MPLKSREKEGGERKKSLLFPIMDPVKSHWGLFQNFFQIKMLKKTFLQFPWDLIESQIGYIRGGGGQRPEMDYLFPRIFVWKGLGKDLGER